MDSIKYEIRENSPHSWKVKIGGDLSSPEEVERSIQEDLLPRLGRKESKGVVIEGIGPKTPHWVVSMIVGALALQPSAAMWIAVDQIVVISRDSSFKEGMRI